MHGSANPVWIKGLSKPGPEALAEKPKSAHINCCEKLKIGKTSLQHISVRAFSELCSTIHVYKVRHSKQADFEQENSVE